MSQRLVQGEVLTLRPLFAQLAGSAYLSSAFAVIPPFLALYALTWNSREWLTVLAVNLAVVVILYGAITRVRGTSITLAPDALIEHGYFGKTVRTPVSELTSVRVIDVYSRRSLESNANIFFLDGNGKTRLRMRGQFWGRKGVESALGAYDLPIETLPEPIARSEMRHLYRSNLYLYERYPALTYLVEGAVLLLVCAPLIAALNSTL